MKYHALTPKHMNLVTELQQNEICPLDKASIGEFIENAKSIKKSNQ